VLERLVVEGCELVIVSPNKPQEFFGELPEEHVDVQSLHLKIGRLWHRYMTFRKHLLYTGPDTPTQRETAAQLRRQLPVTSIVVGVGNSLLRRSPRLRRWCLRREWIVLWNYEVNSFLREKIIDLMLITTPGYGNGDVFLLHSAVRRGIPVVSSILSWDNISTKCFVNPKPDRVLVWSEHMKREVIELQQIPAERVVVTGPAQYDVFANVTRFGSRSQNLQSLGLKPERRLIVYGANHAGFFRDEIEVIRMVAKWVNEDCLGVPCQLLIRLHPQSVTGPYKLDIDPYRALVSDYVKVQVPPVRESSLLWQLPKTDLEHYVRILRDADVVINTASTVSIDAAVLDRPVICIAYDTSEKLPYQRSVQRYYNYTHMENVVSLGAARLARSPDELKQEIINYLRSPDRDREGRNRIVAQQFGRVDGQSARRVVEEVIAISHKRKGHEVR
jgi:hypothetical protein